MIPLGIGRRRARSPNRAGQLTDHVEMTEQRAGAGLLESEAHPSRRSDLRRPMELRLGKIVGAARLHYRQARALSGSGRAHLLQETNALFAHLRQVTRDAAVVTHELAKVLFR